MASRRLYYVDIVCYAARVMKNVNEESRWEPCRYCGDGFPKYLGKKDNFHQYECAEEDCGGVYKVEDGKGAFDLRRGMELFTDSIYFQQCDGCKKVNPVKVVNLRFVCANCKE